MSDDLNYTIETLDSTLAGPFRKPVNAARHYKNSIHDDETAKDLGFSGGTIAASLHLEQFPPFLAAALGSEWYSSGGVSLYFKKATTEGEAVRVRSELPKSGERNLKVWMEDAESNVIAEGTASIGGSDSQSAIRQKIASLPEPTELRMLANIAPGRTTERVRVSVSREQLDQRAAIITEPLNAYTDESEYGGRILTPALEVHALSQSAPLLIDDPSGLGIGLYGAIELQRHGEAVLVDREYEVESTALAVGETPKTEYIYYESRLYEPGGDRCLLSMVLMNRFMKQTSPLWR